MSKILKRKINNISSDDEGGGWKGHSPSSSIIQDTPPKGLHIPEGSKGHSPSTSLLDSLLLPKNDLDREESKKIICTLLTEWKEKECKMKLIPPILCSIYNIKVVDDIDFFQYILFWLMICSPLVFNHIYINSNTRRMHRFLPIMYIHLVKMRGYKCELGDHDKTLYAAPLQTPLIVNIYNL